MADPVVYRIMVTGHEPHPKMGITTTFDDVEPLSPVFFQMTDQALDTASDEVIGQYLRRALEAVRDNRKFSLAQKSMNKFVADNR